MGKTAPGYASTTTDSGLWGSSTSNGKGTSYKAPNWAKDTMGTIGNNLNSTLNNMLNNDFTKDANFQAYQNQFNKTAKQSYDSSVLSSLADRGLMRSSGLQAATNSFNNRLADYTTEIYDNYYNKQQNNLSNMLNISNNLFNYMTSLGSSSQSQAQAVSNYNLNRWQLQNAENQRRFENIMKGVEVAGKVAGMLI